MQAVTERGTPQGDLEVDEVSSKLSLLKVRMQSADGYSTTPVRRAIDRPRKRLSPTPSPARPQTDTQVVTPSDDGVVVTKDHKTSPPSGDGGGGGQVGSASSSSMEVPVGGRTMYGSGTMGLEEHEDGPSAPPQLCPHCNRSFTNPVTFAKHVNACKKPPARRKAFDPSAQRLAEVEETHGPIPKTIKEKKPKKNQNFMAQSEALRAMIKAGRSNDPEEQAEAQAVLAALPPDPNRVECPNCNRKFNAESAERHINVCARVFSNKGSGSGSASGAAKASGGGKAKGHTGTSSSSGTAVSSSSSASGAKGKTLTKTKSSAGLSATKKS